MSPSTEATRFAQDLEWDSLTVLDFVANIEDEFDVIITMNMQAEIETVGQLVDALREADGRQVTDLFSKFDPLIEQRAALLETGVTDPFNLVMEKVESPTVAICNGRRRSCSAPTITWA